MEGSTFSITLRKKVIFWFASGFVTPPLFWVFLIYYTGCFTNQTISGVIFNPILISYVLIYVTAITYWAFKKLKNIELLYKSGDYKNAQKNIYQISILFLIGMVVYSIIGPNTALIGNNVSVKLYIMSWSYAIPIILLFSVPFFIIMLTFLEKWSTDIPLLKGMKIFTFKIRNYITILSSSIGVILTLLISIYALLENFTSDSQLQIDINQIILKLVVLGIFSLIGLIFPLLLINYRTLYQFKRLTDHIDDVANGDFASNISIEERDEMGVLATRIKTKLIGNLRALIKETEELTNAATEGKLDIRADVNKHYGDYRKIISGMNKMLDAVNKPILDSTKIIEQIAKGDIPEQITDKYNGEFNNLKNSLNLMITTLNQLISEMNKLYKEQSAGDYEYYMDDTVFKGVYQQVAQGYNQAVKLHVDNILSILDVIGQYGEGIFDNEMPDLPGKQIIVTKIVNGVRSNLMAVVEDIKKVNQTIASGRLMVKVDADNHKGEYANIINGLGDTINAIIDPLQNLIKNLASITTKIKNGELGERLAYDNLKIAEFAVVVKSMNSAFDALIRPVNMAAINISKVAKGDMPELITEEFKGDFNKIKESINGLISVSEQIIITTQKIAKGELNIEIHRRSSNDHLMIALQKMVAKLSEMVSIINEASENVNAGSLEISKSATSMAQGANEQAASVEEVSASVEEMQATINQNASNASETQKIAIRAANEIEVGSKSVQSTVEAMRTIIEKIQIVSDIADKTDLLAINAAIEAARAGEHGEGFAVVASEVRKLAEMSKEAAKEINTVSKDSLRTAEVSGEMLKTIVPKIKETADLIEEIAIASNEQNSGIHQITTAVSQLNNLSQQNAASAEELSTGSEELTTQANMLKESISYFKIDQNYLKKIKNINNDNNMIRNNSLDNGYNLDMDNTDKKDYENF